MVLKVNMEVREKALRIRLISSETCRKRKVDIEDRRLENWSRKQTTSRAWQTRTKSVKRTVFPEMSTVWHPETSTSHSLSNREPLETWVPFCSLLSSSSLSVSPSLSFLFWCFAFCLYCHQALGTPWAPSPCSDFFPLILSPPPLTSPPQ